MYTYLRLLLEDAELGPEGTPPWRAAVVKDIIVCSCVVFQSNKYSDSDSEKEQVKTENQAAFPPDDIARRFTLPPLSMTSQL